MNERINTGWTPPKKTQEQARRSQAHWWGIDPDEWWAKCQGLSERPDSDYTYNVEHGVCDGTGFTDQQV